MPLHYIKMNTCQSEQPLAPPKTLQLKRYTAQGCIEKYSYMLIRPPRVLYNQNLLKIKGSLLGKFQLQVFKIPFPLSLYTPPNMQYVVLYLHGNSSSRCQGFSHLKMLPERVGLACFDFNGCGNRTEKQFISLGYDEAKEVDLAVQFLKAKGHKVACWGRSMGSVSLLLSTKADILVADSPFSSLSDLCKEIAQSEMPCVCVPFFRCLFPCFFCAVGKDVHQKTSMHPSDLEIIDLARSMGHNRKILLLAAKGDTMINYSHAVKLHQALPCHTELLLFEGTHNSERSVKICKQIFGFIQKHLFPSLEDNQKPSRPTQNDKIAYRQDCQIGSYGLLRDSKAAQKGSKDEVNSRMAVGPSSDKAQ